MNQIVNQAPMGAVSTRFAQVPQQANDLAGGITGGYGIVGYRGKVWSIRYHGNEMQLMRADGDGPRGSIDAVILKGSKTLSKIFYENGYVEGSNAPPDCSSANGVVPDQGVPKQQNPICATCPRNQWGTAAGGGKGKACGDSRRLAIVPLDDMRNEAFGGPMLLRCPASSLQELATFSNKLEQMGYPYYAIGIKISFDPLESYPKFVFNGVRPLTDAEADMVIAYQNSPEVKRIVADEVDPAVLAQATHQATLPPPVAQPVFSAVNGQPPAAVAFGGQPVQPAPVQQAPVQQAPVQQVAQQPVQQAAPVQGGGFGPVAAVQAAPVQQVAQTVQQPVQQVQQAAPAPAQQPVQQMPAGMTGFGPATPAVQQAAPVQQPVQQSFPGIATGAPVQQVQQPAAPTAAEQSFDDRLAALLGGNVPSAGNPAK